MISDGLLIMMNDLQHLSIDLNPLYNYCPGFDFNICILSDNLAELYYHNNKIVLLPFDWTSPELYFYQKNDELFINTRKQTALSYTILITLLDFISPDNNYRRQDDYLSIHELNYIDRLPDILLIKYISSCYTCYCNLDLEEYAQYYLSLLHDVAESKDKLMATLFLYNLSRKE